MKRKRDERRSKEKQRVMQSVAEEEVHRNEEDTRRTVFTKLTPYVFRFEIIKYLSSRDLLRLSWTSKEAQEIVRGCVLHGRAYLRMGRAIILNRKEIHLGRNVSFY